MLEHQARTYAAIVEEVVQDATVTICTLLIHAAPVIALFDSCSTHTFIAKTFGDTIAVFVEDLGYDLVVSNFARVILTTGVCMSSVIVVIQQCIMLTDFTVLPI